MKASRRGWRGVAILGGAMLIAASTGCKRSSTASYSGQNPGTVDADASAQKLEGQITGVNWHIPWRVRNAAGKPMPALIADAREGLMNSQDDSYTMRLRGVRAKLFQEGVHSADIVAAQVDANSDEHIIVGTGGVRVSSLTNPPDTVVTADKVTWNPNSHKMVAVGHAKVTYHPRTGGLPITQSGGRITFDMLLKKIEVESL